jgi:hypothetical protein
MIVPTGAPSSAAVSWPGFSWGAVERRSELARLQPVAELDLPDIARRQPSGCS